MKLNNQKALRKLNMTKMSNNFKVYLLIIPAILILWFIIWRPQIMGFIWSFFRMKGYKPIEFIGLSNYSDVITDPEFMKVLANTMMYVIWSLIVGFLPPVILAIMINEMMHFKNFFKVTIYMPTIIPAISAMLIWKLMYYPDATGLFNMFFEHFGQGPFKWLGNENWAILFIIIASTWRGMGSAMLLYFAALQGINSELYEAAIIDGAGFIKRIVTITVPQIAGVLLLTMIRQIISVFQILEEPLSMTGGGPNGATISIGYQLYQYGFVKGRIGHALALGGIIFAILMVITCFYFFLNNKAEENL